MKDKKSVQNDSYSTVDKYALIFELLNPQACAGNSRINVPGRCIVAGYVTEYGKNGSCGGRPDGRLDLDAQQNAVKPGLSSACSAGKGISCNPLFYGYNESGSPYCVSGATSHATEQCNGQSVLRRDPKNEVNDINRILSSFLKDKNGHSLKSAQKNAKGDIEISTESAADYDIVKQQLDGLEKTFRDALDICEAGEKHVSMDTKINTPSNLMKTKEDQRSACNAIVKRYIAVQQLQLAPTNPPRDSAGDVQKRANGDGCPTTNDGTCACSVEGGKVSGGPVKNKCGGIGVVDDEGSVAGDLAPPKKEAGFCRKFNDDGTTSITTPCGLAGVAAIAAIGWYLYKRLGPNKVDQKNYDPVASPVTVPATGTTNPITTNPGTTPPVVPNPPIVPVPPSEGGSGLAPTTPTDTGTVRKLAPTPGAR